MTITKTILKQVLMSCKFLYVRKYIAIHFHFKRVLRISFSFTHSKIIIGNKSEILYFERLRNDP